VSRARAGDYDAKRAVILDAAAALFARHGFGSTSIAMLSEAAGGSKAWIYHYYDGKEAILFDILDRHLRALVVAVEAADDPSLPAGPRLEGLVLALLRAYENADDTHAVQINDLGRLPGEQQAYLRGLERRIVATFAGVLRAAVPGLAARPELVAPATMSVLGILNWQHRWWRRDGELSLEAYARFVVALVLEGLAGAGRAVERSVPA
jgi:TetR/AcrR family transcriptional regulator